MQRESRFGTTTTIAFLCCLLVFAFSLVGSATAQQVTRRPCDLLAAITPCVAAISTTRALYSGYIGPLYQVTRESDNSSRDIGLLPSGYADAAVQDSFCVDTRCGVSRLYDQSPNQNDLTPAPPGGAARGPGVDGRDFPARAKVLPITVDGHAAYGISVTAGTGYRNDATRGIPVRGEPEGVYMVASAHHVNAKCCFDFGNAETNNSDNGAGHMDAINLRCASDECNEVTASLDMENGLLGHLTVPENTTFVTAMGANDGQHTYALYQGNAESGSLTTTGLLLLPVKYVPMQQEGAIVLGIGGDNSNFATGEFFEGIMTRGMPTSQAMEAVQGNIVSAHYSVRSDRKL